MGFITIEPPFGVPSIEQANRSNQTTLSTFYTHDSWQSKGEGKPMVNSPLMNLNKALFLRGGGWHWGVPLDSHEGHIPKNGTIPKKSRWGTYGLWCLCTLWQESKPLFTRHWNWILALSRSWVGVGDGTFALSKPKSGDIPLYLMDTCLH